MKALRIPQQATDLIHVFLDFLDHGTLCLRNAYSRPSEHTALKAAGEKLEGHLDSGILAKRWVALGFLVLDH